mgnify:CR=1 FL=1
MQAFEFFQLLSKNIFNSTLKIAFFLILVGDVKNLHCCIDLINRANLRIFKFRNSKFDLQENFVNN